MDVNLTLTTPRSGFSVIPKDPNSDGAVELYFMD